MNPLSFMDALGRQVWTDRKALAGPLWMILGVMLGSSVLTGTVGVLTAPTVDPMKPDMTGAALASLISVVTLPVIYLGVCWLGLCLSARMEGRPLPPLKDAVKGRYVGAILLGFAFLAMALVVAAPGLVLVGLGYVITAAITASIAMAMSGVLLAATLRGHSLSEAIRITTQPKHIGLRWGLGHWKTYLLVGLAMLGLTYGLSSVSQIVALVLATVTAFQSGIGNPEAAMEMNRTLQLSGLIASPLTSAAYTLSMAVYVGGSVWLARRIDRQKGGDDLMDILVRLEASA